MSRHSPDELEPVGENAGRENVGVRSRSGDEPAWMWTDDDFTASPEFAPDLDANLALGAPSRPALGAAIRRRAWLWGATALLGLALGGAAFVLKPPPYKATTSVLLTQSPTEPPQDQILTEVALLESRTVAEAAMRSLGLPLSAKAIERFSASISATSLTDRVIQITVKGTSSNKAVSAAKATANAFLLIRNDELRSDERLTIAALTQMITKDKQRLRALAAQIASFPRQPASPQSKLASLQAQQTELRSRLTGLVQAATTYESTAAVTTASMVHGSQVLDPAIPAPRSGLRYPLLYVGGGLLGGLAVGLGCVITAALVSRRLRRRGDIARVLDGPVLLSVGRVRAGGGLLGRSWPTAARRPAIRRVVAYLRRSLPAGQDTPTLAVVAVDDLRVPALTLVSLASSLAGDGKRVLIADLTPSMAVGRLLDVEVGVKLTEADGHEVVVAVPEPGVSLPRGPVKASLPADQPLEDAYRTADIMLTLVALDPALGADHLPTWAGSAVVMLTAGKSSATKINAVGEMIRAAGTTLISAVLLDADRSDESLGFETSPVNHVSAEPAPDRTRTVGGVHDGSVVGDKTGDFEPINGRDVNGDGLIGSEPPRAWRR